MQHGLPSELISSHVARFEADFHVAFHREWFIISGFILQKNCINIKNKKRENDSI